MHRAVYFAHAQPEASQAGAVEAHHDLGQAGDLLHVHVFGPRHPAHHGPGLAGVVGQLGEVFAENLEYHVLLSARNQLIEAHLDGLLKAEGDAGNDAHGGGHLLG